MKAARAVAVFTVEARGIRVGVRVLPTIADVDAEFSGGAQMRSNRRVHAFFHAPAGGRGTIVLPAAGRLVELVPHEAVHVVMREGTIDDEEEIALSVGRLSAAIFAELRRRRIEVRP